MIFLILACIASFLFAAGAMVLEGLWPDGNPPAWLTLVTDIAQLLILA